MDFSIVALERVREAWMRGFFVCEVNFHVFSSLRVM